MSIKSLVVSIAAAVTLTGAAVSANAGNLVDMEVLSRDGYRQASFPTYWFQGETYLEARQGQEFRVRLRNNTGERVLAVLSVDGINAISGQTASPDQAGYVLGPYQTLDVDGWRKSNARTAAFYFTHFGDSYGARTGRPDNLGVIGAAIFREQRYNHYAPYEQEYSDGYGDSYRGKSADAPAAAGRSESKSYGARPAPSAPLGTGHGRQEYRPSVNVEFEREEQVAEFVNVRYDSYQNLIAQGVIPRRGRYHNRPEAFPNGGFVPDPGYSLSAPYRPR